MKKPFIILLIFSLTLSCARQKLAEEGLTVSFDQETNRERVVVDEEANVDYGPSPGEKIERLASKEKRNPDDAGKSSEVLALDLYPALYMSLAYVSTFIELEKEDIQVKIISSSGFTSVIAALYAKYEASNMVEWKAFELFQKLEGLKVYSGEWRDELAEFLRGEFGDLKLNQLKKILVVPRAKGRKIVMDLNEKVASAIMASVDIEEKSSLLTANNFSYLKGLKEFGADRAFRISFLPAELDFKRPDGFVFGVYSRLRGTLKSSNEKDVFEYGEALKGDLDSVANMSDILHQAKEKNRVFASVVKEYLEENTAPN